MDRLSWLEIQLDREDLTDQEYLVFNTEANELIAAKNARKIERDAIMAQQKKEEQEELELSAILALTEEEVERMYVDACIKYQDVNGMSFESWYKQSLQYYNIDVQYNVHAKARSSNTVEVISHVSRAQAQLTILKRIKYKFYDHAKRGRDFAWDIAN